MNLTKEEKLRQAEEIMAELRKLFGEGVEFSCETVSKTNRQLTGIILELPEAVSSPIVYLEDMPEGSVQEKARCAAAAFQKALQMLGEKAPLVTCMKGPLTVTDEDLRKNLYFQAVSRERNPGLAESAAHFDVLDLMGVFRLFMHLGPSQTASAELPTGFLDGLGELPDLIRLAGENTVRLFGIRFFHLQIRFSGGRFQQDWVPLDFANCVMEKNQFYILSNDTASFGASLILIPEVMRTIGRNARGDFFVIPTSKDEVFLMLCGGWQSVEDLSDLLQAMNFCPDNTTERFLTTSIYRCNWKTGELSIAQ